MKAFKISSQYFNWDTGRPARQISYRHLFASGRVSSHKNSSTQEFESLLEQDFLLLLEFDRAVSRYATQPITIRWKDNGRQHRYTPDVLVEYTPTIKGQIPLLKPTLFEVKPEAILRAEWDSFKPRFKAAIRWCRQHGCRFKLVTERHIRTPYLSNIKFLRQFTEPRFAHFDPVEIQKSVESLRQAMTITPNTTPQSLLDCVTSSLAQRARQIPYIWYMINTNVIEADLDNLLTMETPIRLLDPNGIMIGRNSTTEPSELDLLLASEEMDMT